MYRSPTKCQHRAGIVALFDEMETKHPILYVDDKCGDATSFFLDKGIPRKYLKPVNWEKAACDAIYDATNIRATHANIIDFVKTRPRDAYSIVWLDLECKTVDPKCLHAAVACATYVILVLANRDKKHEAIAAPACNALTEAGARMMHHYRYEGASGKANMTYIQAMRESVHKELWSAIKASKIITPDRTMRSHEKTKTRRVLPVRKTIDKTQKNTPLAARRKKKTPLEGLLGTTLYLPKSLWKGEEAEDEDVQRCGNAFIYKVTGTYNRNKTLKVTAVTPSGRLADKEETWTLEPNLVRQYRVPPPTSRVGPVVVTRKGKKLLLDRATSA